MILFTFATKMPHPKESGVRKLNSLVNAPMQYHATKHSTLCTMDLFSFRHRFWIIGNLHGSSPNEYSHEIIPSRLPKWNEGYALHFLKPVRLEAQGAAVLRHGSDDVVRSTVGDICVNFECDLDRGS